MSRRVVKLFDDAEWDQQGSQARKRRKHSSRRVDRLDELRPSVSSSSGELKRSQHAEKRRQPDD
jgi:hypothetical protein